MSPRKLRPDEVELWQRVAKTADRLKPERPAADVMAEVFEKAPPAKNGISQKFKAPQTTDAKTSNLPGIMTSQKPAPLKMDRKAYDRLKRGKLKPEGRIDLHGMTMDEAQPALTAFIMSSVAKERRLVLVITGKGQRKAVNDVGPIPERPGILRRNVPHWLQVPPLAQVVLEVVEAHGRHGGGGAYYVYLRRKR